MSTPGEKLPKHSARVEPLYVDPATISEICANAIVDIHNRRERGEVTAIEAKALMDEVEKMQIAVGEGMFDRYGPPPEELDYLFEGDARYWEKPVGER